MGAMEIGDQIFITATAKENIDVAVMITSTKLSIYDSRFPSDVDGLLDGRPQALKILCRNCIQTRNVNLESTKIHLLGK